LEHHVPDEERIARCGVGEPEDEGGVELLVVGVVVCDVRGVPELSIPGRNVCVRSSLSTSVSASAGTLLDELPELTGADPVSAAQVDQGTGTDCLPWAGDVVALVLVSTRLIDRVLTEPEWAERLTEHVLRCPTPLPWSNVALGGTSEAAALACIAARTCA
jgi:hypothetical protein